MYVRSGPHRRQGRSLVVLLGAVGAAGLLGAGVFYLLLVRDLPDLRSVEDYRPSLTSRVFDRNGRLIGSFFEQRRQLTRLEAIPEHVIQAFVASEDSTFFEHTGLDYASILRAAWVNIRAGGEIRQGGSTITQQMVKGLLLSPERSFRRKIREMLLARRIEQRFSKQEILYLYLNQIYFGRGAYGIGEAARTYFAKPVGDLTPSEGALLAGLPKAPSRFSPYSNPDAAETRRLYVLERMFADRFLDRETYEAARAKRPELRTPPERENFEPALYFTEEVRRYLFNELGGDTVLGGGLVIETTLDIDLQRAATAAVRRGLHDHDRRQGYRGPVRRVPIVSVDEELHRLAKENALELPAPPSEVASAEEGTDGDLETAADAGVEPSVLDLPDDRPYLGVVLDVDPQAKTAEIGFAPWLHGVVHLEDVRWAREPDPSERSKPVKKIEQVFEIGDVAHFVRIGLDPVETDDSGLVPGPAYELRVNLHQDAVVQGALLSFEVETGDVLAMVGGSDFRKSEFNRVTQARRQPGSAFKPLIYGAALERGYTPVSILWDRPVVYVDKESGFTWRPQNYGRAFYGPIPMRTALARSVNNATVHLFRDVGVDFVIEYARRLGLESSLNRDLSLALGSSSVSLLELTRAYAVFPSGGRRVTPIFIRRVTAPDGTVLLEDVPLGNVQEKLAARDEGDAFFGIDIAADATDENGDGEIPEAIDPDQLISPEEAYLITSLLRAVVTDPRGTGWRLRALKRPSPPRPGPPTTRETPGSWASPPAS